MAVQIITIDGPAGSGKTTVSKALAKRLGWIYVDTGALYRGVAFEVNRTGTDYNNDSALESLLVSLSLELVTEKGSLRLLSSGCDITDQIRTPGISMLASAVSAKPRVRAALLEMQRLIATKNDAVFEGRDMGTVVFPKADHKFFLSADLLTRAKRRHGESDGQSLCEVEKDIAKRDKNDSERKQAPLKAADDAVMIDSTDLTVEEVISRMLHEIAQ
jgi:cytidylate kinase